MRLAHSLTIMSKNVKNSRGVAKINIKNNCYSIMNRFIFNCFFI